MMRHGCITQSLLGPLRLAKRYSEMVNNVKNINEAWYKIWSSAYISKLLLKPKRFKNKCYLAVEDLVYCKNPEKVLGLPWILGMVVRTLD